MDIARQQSRSAPGVSSLGFRFGLRRAFAVNLGLIGIAFPASFATTLLLSRILGPAEYGMYAYVLAWATLLVIPATLGFDVLLIRELAAAHTAGDLGLLRGLLRGAVRLVGLASLAVCLAGGCVIWGLPVDSIKFGAPLHLLFGFALVPLLALRQVYKAVLQGLQHPLLGMLPHSFVQPLTMLLLTAVAAVIYRDQLAAWHATGLQIVAAIVSLAAGWLLFRNCLPGEVYTASPRIEYWSCLRAASPFLLTQLIYVATEKSSMLILGMTAALREVGIFALSSSLAMLLALPLTTANAIISGRVAHLHKCGQKAELQRLFGSAVRLCLLVTAPLALLQIIWGDKILGLLGDDFASGFLTLRILAFGQIFNVAAGSVGVALNMSGHTQETVRGTAYSSVLGLLLCALLIPRFGAPGAALAQSIAVIAFNVFLTVKVRQKLDLDPSILAGLRRQVA